MSTPKAPAKGPSDSKGDVESSGDSFFTTTRRVGMSDEFNVHATDAELLAIVRANRAETERIRSQPYPSCPAACGASAALVLVGRW
jgi:hypothetical protein